MQDRPLRNPPCRLTLPFLKRAAPRRAAPASGVSLLGATSPALPDDGLPGGYATYRNMLLDPQVKACLTTKKFAVLSQGWAIHAASDAPEDQAVAAFVRDGFCRDARERVSTPCTTCWTRWPWASRWSRSSIELDRGRAACRAWSGWRR